jgi:5-(carboxyamino)imidazole ribonucleotide mutase
MPNGIPVATVALNAAKNAGILAAQILAASDSALLDKIIIFKNVLSSKVLKSVDDVEHLDLKMNVNRD